MPPITKQHMKHSIIQFSIDAVNIINSNLNLNDLDHRQDIPQWEQDGWFYYLHKSIANIKPEIRIKRQNYRTGNRA